MEDILGMVVAQDAKIIGLLDLMEI